MRIISPAACVHLKILSVWATVCAGSAATIVGHLNLVVLGRDSEPWGGGWARGGGDRESTYLISAAHAPLTIAPLHSQR